MGLISLVLRTLYGLLYHPVLIDSYGTLVEQKTAGKLSHSEENTTSVAIGRYLISREIS
jgi:hypothetical protein